MIAVVTGGRDSWDVPTIEGVLSDFHAATPFRGLYYGCATGADTVARRWAEANGVPATRFMAHWQDHGRSAGPIRNRGMLRAALACGLPVRLFAFAGGRGTADCVRQAKQMGIEVVDCRAAPEADDG